MVTMTTTTTTTDSTLTLAAAATASAAFLYAAIRLIKPILFPTIIAYPWPRHEQKKYNVAFCGSFNPPHNGHIAMILYLCQRYGKVMVVIGKNPNKQYKVSPEARVTLIRRMLHEMAPMSSIANVEVRVVEGYIWRTLQRQSGTTTIHAFVRGIRSWAIDGAEERHLQILNTWGPLVLGPVWWPLPTFFLQGKPEYRHVSSTLVRSICRGGGGSSSSGGEGVARTQQLNTLVPTCVQEEVAKLYGSTN